MGDPPDSKDSDLPDPESDSEPTTVLSSNFTPGKVLGKRYRLIRLLGRGGMGEVWQAYDLKLRLEVALKSVRRGIFSDARALETLRQEVRSAREVLSPEVCRIFDLVEVDGQELSVTACRIDGSVMDAFSFGAQGGGCGDASDCWGLAHVECAGTWSCPSGECQWVCL